MNPLVSACCAAVFAMTAAGALAQTAGRDVIALYDATQIPFDSYTVVKRLGVQGWRSAIGIPAFRDEASARQAALNEAARSGADGVINVHCLSRSDSLFNPAGYFCYGNAIKLKNERRVVAQ